MCQSCVLVNSLLPRTGGARGDVMSERGGSERMFCTLCTVSFVSLGPVTTWTKSVNKCLSLRRLDVHCTTTLSSRPQRRAVRTLSRRKHCIFQLGILADQEIKKKSLKWNFDSAYV